MMMNVKQSVKLKLVGETEVFEEILPQCHFVYHKSHDLTWAQTWATIMGR
jgi:hypothetical protein